MSSLIVETARTYWELGRKVKRTPSGWVSGNAVCCHHNGTSADTRGRGGMHITEDGVSWHCFNCGFKASWQPGRKISEKFKKLLQWLNVPDELITKCSFEALRSHDDAKAPHNQTLIPTFFDKALPRGARLITDWLAEPEPPAELTPVLEYLASRQYYLDDYSWAWSDEDGMRNRLIIPFYYRNKIVGYTARLIRDGKLKYLSEQQPGYVFNLDRQTDDRKYVFVTEGPLDAISIDGVALMGSEVGPGQQIMINQLHRQVVVVPDRDRASMKLVKQAMELGWAVSFPEWTGDIKDVNDSVKKYGRLYTLYTIITNIQSTELKIQLAMKHWFKEQG